MRLDVVKHRWAGTYIGDDYLRHSELDVARTACGITERGTLTLPTPGGLLVDPAQGQALPVAQVRRAPDAWSDGDRAPQLITVII
ncbi:hypothetical protein ACH473_03405 [Cellulosimicrobium funkei]|uniref:hypothetical protein n=1 Tax=Cellulosimicrobium funkei TaxID=264251 RepID=UPI0037A67891